MLKPQQLLLGVVALMLAACQGLPFGAKPTQGPPTFDPALLSATPIPTVTPEATYTPYPTTVRIPSRTPPPTFESVVTLIPYVPSATPTVSNLPTATPRPRTPTPVIGVQGVGQQGPELVPILTFGPIIFCRTWFLAQIGIKNIGTLPARDFNVEWYWGWGDVNYEHVDELGETAGPLWFFNGLTALQCDSTTTLTAWIKIDPEGKLTDEIDKTNNTDSQQYTGVIPTPTPGGDGSGNAGEGN